MSQRVLGVGASVGAVLFALLVWAAAEALTEALGVQPFRPLVLVTALFLSLTALQAGWDRAERLIRSSSHQNHD